MSLIDGMAWENEYGTNQEVRKVFEEFKEPEKIMVSLTQDEKERLLKGEKIQTMYAWLVIS